MTFLNSIFLGALAAVAIPLLIHFLSRRRIKIVDFSSLKFLMIMQKSKLRWLKILEILLLAIRMLILALLALAFARPALTSRHAASHAPASIVFLIDDSPSVERLTFGGTSFDDMKRGMGQVMDMLNASDEIILITLAGNPTAYGPYGDFGRAREIISSLQPQPSSPSFREGLKKAAEVLAASHNLNREIYVFSDFQPGPWWDGSFAEIINPDYRYFAIKYAADELENVGLTKIEFPSQLLVPAEEFEITAHLRNYGDQPLKSRLVGLSIDGSRRAQVSVDLKRAGSDEASFAVISDKPGHHRGYFEIEDDDYGPDNRFYFDFDIPRKITVLGVAETGEDVKVIQRCFGMPGHGYIEFTGVDMAGFARLNPSDYDVIILNDVAALTRPLANSLSDFLAGGGGLFIILGGKSNLNTFREFLHNKAGLMVGEKVASSGGEGGSGYFNLERFDLTHSIFKIYAPSNQEAAKIPTLKLAAYYPVEGGVPLAWLSGDRPVMAISQNAKILALGFGLDGKSSDIALHSFIVPFMIRSVEQLASSSSAAQDYYISGQPITINLPRQVGTPSVKLARSFEDPSGSETSPFDETIEVSRGAYGSFVNIPQAGYPGFYTLSAGPDTIAYFSVNHDSTESTSDDLDFDDVKSILGADIINLEGQNAGITESIMQAKFGVELWKYCLVLALVLLIAESVIVKKAS